MAAPTRVQDVATGNTGGSAPAATFVSSVTSGNTVLCFIRLASLGSAPSSVTDTQSNSYSLLKSATSADPNVYCYGAFNVNGGSSFTVTANGAGSGYTYSYCVEYSGVSGTSPDATDNGTGSGVTDLVSSGITTTDATDLIVAFASQSNFATYTAGADYTLVNGSITSAGGFEEYAPGATKSGYVTHLTSNITNQYALVVIALKGTSGGGGGSATIAMPSMPLTGVQ